MQLTAVFGVLSALSTALASIPLIVEVPASEKKCMYVRAHREGVKIRAEFNVMSGGQFDIDATLTRPDGTVAESASRADSDEWMLNAPEVGDYELCFYNEMSTFADKAVQFEFEAETPAVVATLPDAVGEEHTREMERYINNIDQKSSAISRKVTYLKARMSRNESTVRSTSSRVWWFTVFELLAIVGMAVFNVTIVQIFFKGSRKNIV